MYPYAESARTANDAREIRRMFEEAARGAMRAMNQIAAVFSASNEEAARAVKMFRYKLQKQRAHDKELRSMSRLDEQREDWRELHVYLWRHLRGVPPATGRTGRGLGYGSKGARTQLKGRRGSRS